jgi:hypothetical protein
MAYVSNCLADIEIRAKQRAALEAEQRAFLRRGGKITEVPGFVAIPPTLTQQQRIAASVAEAGAKLSAWRSIDGRHNNRNAKRLKREAQE